MSVGGDAHAAAADRLPVGHQLPRGGGCTVTVMLLLQPVLRGGHGAAAAGHVPAAALRRTLTALLQPRAAAVLTVRLVVGLEAQTIAVIDARRVRHGENQRGKVGRYSWRAPTLVVGRSVGRAVPRLVDVTPKPESSPAPGVGGTGTRWRASNALARAIADRLTHSIFEEGRRGISPGGIKAAGRDASGGRWFALIGGVLDDLRPLTSLSGPRPDEITAQLGFLSGTQQVLDTRHSCCQDSRWRCRCTLKTGRRRQAARLV